MDNKISHVSGIFNTSSYLLLRDEECVRCIHKVNGDVPAFKKTFRGVTTF